MKLIFSILLCLFLLSFGITKVIAQDQPIIYSTDSLLGLMDDRFYSTYVDFFPNERAKINFQIEVTKKDTSPSNLKNNYLLYKIYFRDSLFSIIDTSKNPTEIVNAYGQLTNLNPYDSIDYYFSKCRDLMDSLIINTSKSEMSNSLKQYIKFKQLFSFCYHKNEEYYTAYQLMTDCLNLAKSVNDSGETQTTLIWLFMPQLYELDINMFKEQQSEYLKVIKQYNRDQFAYRNLYDRIASSAKMQMNYSEAKKYYYLVYDMILNNKNENDIKGAIWYDRIHENLSDVNYLLGYYDSSIYYIRNLIKSQHIHKDFLEEDNSNAYNRIGLCYYKLGNYDSAFFNFEKAVQFKPIFSNFFYCGLTAMNSGQKHEARKYLERALEVQNNMKTPIFLEPDSMEVADAYAKFFKWENNYKSAFIYYSQYVPKSNSIKLNNARDESTRKAAYISYKFQKQKELFKLENKLQQEKQQKQRTRSIAYLGGSGGIMALLVLAFISVKNKRKRDVAELSNQISDVEMKALRSQMNPHFIFNALQSIQNFLISNKSEDANAYLLKFSRLMRLVLENSQQQEVVLKDDIQALELYMQLEQLRFTLPFNYEIILDSSIDSEVDTILPLLLQPFVENAIWHGLQYKTEPGKIMIHFFKENEILICVVEDNGVGRSYKRELIGSNLKKESLGMKLTEERINLLNKVHRVQAKLNILDLFDLENKPSGTRVEVMLPIVY